MLFYIQWLSDYSVLVLYCLLLIHGLPTSVTVPASLFLTLWLILSCLLCAHFDSRCWLRSWSIHYLISLIPTFILHYLIHSFWCSRVFVDVIQPWYSTVHSSFLAIVRWCLRFHSAARCIHLFCSAVLMGWWCSCDFPFCSVVTSGGYSCWWPVMTCYSEWPIPIRWWWWKYLLLVIPICCDDHLLFYHWWYSKSIVSLLLTHLFLYYTLIHCMVLFITYLCCSSICSDWMYIVDDTVVVPDVVRIFLSLEVVLIHSDCYDWRNFCYSVDYFSTFITIDFDHSCHHWYSCYILHCSMWRYCSFYVICVLWEMPPIPSTQYILLLVLLEAGIADGRYYILLPVDAIDTISWGGLCTHSCMMRWWKYPVWYGNLLILVVIPDPMWCTTFIPLLYWFVVIWCGRSTLYGDDILLMHSACGKFLLFVDVLPVFGDGVTIHPTNYCSPFPCCYYSFDVVVYHTIQILFLERNLVFLSILRYIFIHLTTQITYIHFSWEACSCCCLIHLMT